MIQTHLNLNCILVLLAYFQIHRQSKQRLRRIRSHVGHRLIGICLQQILKGKLRGSTMSVPRHADMPLTILGGVDHPLCQLPPRLKSVISKISYLTILLKFPARGLTKLQRRGIGAADEEAFEVNITFDIRRQPDCFCVHLAQDGIGRHSPWKIHTQMSPDKHYCYGRPNRGTYQLSRIIWHHLRYNFVSFEKTYDYIDWKLSKFGEGCLICGVGQFRVQRTTTCGSFACMNKFDDTHVKMSLSEIWLDPPVMDLLVSALYACTESINIDLLEDCFGPLDGTLHFLNHLPPIPALRDYPTSCLNSRPAFDLDRALARWIKPGLHLEFGSELLYGICNLYRGFLVSATGPLQIPQFGPNQFLLANTDPETEVSFAGHLKNYGCSIILFHGTTFDRLFPILCEGLQVLRNTKLMKNAAFYGRGIYLADEPSVAWNYARPSTPVWPASSYKTVRVLLGCHLAGPKPIFNSAPEGMYVFDNDNRVVVRYIFLLHPNATMPTADSVRPAMSRVIWSLQNYTC